MENEKQNEFIKKEKLNIGRASFLADITYPILFYIGITYWLNYVRPTASLWFIWILIIIQFILYFSIFIICYKYFKKCGLNKFFGIMIFIILAFLGRVENWEFFIIPFSIITIAILLSFRLLDEYKEVKSNF